MPSLGNISRLFVSIRAQLEMEAGQPVTNRQLAELLGTSERAISELMHGKRKCTEVGWLLKLLSQLPEETQFDQLRRALAESSSAKPRKA